MKTFNLLILTAFVSQFGFAQEEQEPTKTEIKVDGKKSKKGSNVYNFNFYNKKDKKNEEPEVAKPEKKPTPKTGALNRKSLRKGNGIEFGLVRYSHTGDMGDTSELDLGVGLRLGYLIMDEFSGSYLTPGIMLLSAGADYDGLGSNFMARQYDGSAVGPYLKIGKLIERNSEFSIDAGLELSYLTGDLSSDTIFGNGNYKFSSANVMAYAGPVFSVNGFLVTGLLHMGAGRVEADEVIDGRNYSNKGIKPMYGISLNTSFVF